jgi:hypothetical protein
MPQIEITRKPSSADKQTVKELFYAMPMMERGKPILSEMTWVLLGRQELEGHKNILPDYCYNIFDVFQRTYFKGFPLISETVLVINQAGLESAKTVEQAKKVLRLDWKNLGRMFGIAARCFRFAELESADDMKLEGFGDSTPDKTKELFTVIFGRQWVEENQERILTEPLDKIMVDTLKQHIASTITQISEMLPKWDSLSYQWSPEAMIEFKEGMAEGMASFLDEKGQLAGESPRSGIYVFLLLAWPEIKAMLESKPKKTLSDLHGWMKPVMRGGVTADIEINTLRDVCATPPSGIGLSLRPFKSRLSKSSA